MKTSISVRKIQMTYLLTLWGFARMLCIQDVSAWKCPETTTLQASLSEMANSCRIVDHLTACPMGAIYSFDTIQLIM